MAYGTTEVLWVDGEKETRDIAARVGYETLSDGDSRWPSGYEAMRGRLFKNVVAQFIGLICLINQATTEIWV